MAGLLFKFLSLFKRSEAQALFNNTENQATQSVVENSAIVVLPSTYSIITAQYGFYTTVIGNIDDKKPLTVPQKLVVSIVEQSMKDKNKRIKSVPRLPTVIPKLVQSLRDSKTSAKDFVNIINKDPAISTAVLKLANSVYFNPTSNRVTSIDTAVVKLGIEGLRSVLAAAVMQPVIQCKTSHFTQFGHKLWMHSLCCAVACEIIAKQRGLEPFKAYLLGLVHDIGKITLFSELSNHFQLNAPTDSPGYAAFAPLMQSTAETLSHTIAQDWSLPEELCEALAQQINLSGGSMINPYAHVLFQANLICEIHAIIGSDESQTEAANQALVDLSLPANLFAQLDAVTIELR